MKKAIKKILIGTVLVAFVAAGYGFYLFNKKPADVRVMSAAYTLSADSLVSVYNQDEKAADKEFLNQVVEIYGTVTKVILEPSTGQATVMLSTDDPLAGVTCSFYDNEASQLKSIQQGQRISVKGVCTGKLMDVVLNKCSIQH
jgi:tRNA_anti-like